MEEDDHSPALTFKDRQEARQQQIDALLATNNPALIVSEAFVSLTAHGCAPEIVDGLYRLAEHEDAKRAWERLFGKAITKSDESFFSVVYAIGNGVSTPVPSRWKRNSSAIRRAGNRAADLAQKLLYLITENATLDFSGNELLHPARRAALSRIIRGVAFSDGGRMAFSPKVESKLNELQARDFPDFHDLTTFEASNLLEGLADINLEGHADINASEFQWQLRKFAELARLSVTREPIVPNPGAGRFIDARLFSTDACWLLKQFYGNPNAEIVAAFATAIFETDIDGDTVKKWWRRRGDNYDDLE